MSNDSCPQQRPRPKNSKKTPIALHKRAWSGWPIWLPSNPPGMNGRTDADNKKSFSLPPIPLVPTHLAIFELDAELQMLLDDVLDGDRRRDHDAARLRKFGQQ